MMRYDDERSRHSSSSGPIPTAEEEWESSGDEEQDVGEEEEEEESPPTMEQEGGQMMAVVEAPTVCSQADNFRLLCERLRSPPGYYSPERQDRGSSSSRFMMLDLEVSSCRTEGTQVTMYGRTVDGKSMTTKVTGWYPYLYIRAPEGWQHGRASLKDSARVLLEEKLHTRLKDTKLQVAIRNLKLKGDLIVGIEQHRGKDIKGYLVNGEMLMLKISVATPQLIKALRECFHGYTAEASNTTVRVSTHIIMIYAAPVVLRYYYIRSLSGGMSGCCVGVFIL